MSIDRRIPVTALEAHGTGLSRPECVIATRSGDVFVPEWPGGVTVVHPDGQTHTWRAVSPAVDLRPNGIAVASDGSFLIANLGDDGGVWRLDRSGLLSPVLTEVDGVPLPPANFVTIDEQDRIWISVSHATGSAPAGLACGCRGRIRRRSSTLPDRASSRTACATPTKFDRIQPGSGCMSSKRLDDGCGAFRFERREHSAPLKRCSPWAEGFFPDGFAFDEEGGLWVTSLVSNRLLRFHDDRMEIVLEDVNTDFVDRVEQAFASRTMAAEHLGRIPRNAAAATHQRGIWRAGSADRLSGFAPRLLLVPLSRECQRRNPAALVTVRRRSAALSGLLRERARAGLKACARLRSHRRAPASEVQKLPSRVWWRRLTISAIARSRCFACRVRAWRQSPCRMASSSARCSRLDWSSDARSRTVVIRAR